MTVVHLAIQPDVAVCSLVRRAVAVLAVASLALTVDSSLRADEASDSASSNEGIMKVTEIEGISEYRLDNGVRALLFPDPSKDVVTVSMTVFVGSRHEGYGEAGMAHLLEHMLFKGTPDHPDIPKALKDRGAGNSFNGTTSTDRTNYYETLPAEDGNLEFALRLEADRLVNSKILGEDLASEMTVVRNEFERGENSPMRVLLQRMQSSAYEWHNYGRSTIGNRSDIERVPIVKLREFYRKYYRPDNVMVVIAGKFDEKEALKYLQEYFGSLKQPNKPIDPTYTTEPPQDGERTVVVRRVGDVQYVGAAYHVPAASHPEFAAIMALGYVFGDEPSGRLYRGLVETEIATNVFASASPFAEPGLLQTIAEVPSSGSIEKTRSTLIEVMENSLIDEPVTDKEVERAVQNMLKNREMEATDVSRLAISLSNWGAQGDWRLYFLFRDNVEKLTREQVQQAAEKYLVRSNRTIGLFIPTEAAERVEIPEAPDLEDILDGYEGRKAIAAGEQIDPSPMAIENRTERGDLIGGIRYALLPKKTRGEAVSIMLTIRFGTEASLQDKIGAVELMGILMARGTESLDYTALQDELTRLRTELSMNSTIGLLQMNVKTKREHLTEVCKLIGDILRRPRLEGAELEVLQRQIATNLESGSTEPMMLAPRQVRKTLSPYPPDHVLYVKSIEDEVEMYKAVTVDEIRSLHAGYLSNQDGELVAVGDFDPEEFKTLMKQQLADWESAQPYVRVPRDPHPDVAGGLELIETPDKANAALFSGLQIAMRDDDPQYAALVLGNFILGGGSLSSRLGNRVRQQEGLSYSIASSLSGRAKDERVDFGIMAIANPSNKDRLLAAIREELVRMREDGISEAELDEAKTAYLQAARVRRSQDRALVSELLGTIFTDRSMAYYAQHDDQIEAASVQDVNDAIRKYIDPDKLVIVVAGDFKKAQ